MDNLEIRKSLELDKIYKAREVLNQSLLNGLITNKDIYCILKKDSSFMLGNPSSYRELILKQVAINPFILCDQECVDFGIKKILPTILSVRSSMEIEELEMMFELGLITEEELKNEKEMIKFNYYLSSNEGVQIFKNGQVKVVKDNVLRKNIR